MQFFTIITVLFATAAAAAPYSSESPLSAREIAEAKALGVAHAERSIGSTICKGACAIACNSTILALAQTKCLKICNSKC
ncbi:hypothetical protein HYFRA_00010316 [Hymenoscyphus fraxineus]|uniref:Uncharacterized protein n=1 Tax=Hymenoscyphus fraxineus TaxID=746836 RepID=A0A9N9KW58_9HELO|nr:hypothetical protein HYFRA_00010316 [Hymenoscyphus fraxineus]